MPPPFFVPTTDDHEALETLAAEVPRVQDTLVANHPQLTGADRGAHQQQIAASRVTLHVENALPPELLGLGLFVPGRAHTGLARLSTGLGCPHAETDADFLGLMAAFQLPSGQRTDFIAINDPTSPTDTPEEFVALLKATADAATGGGPFSSQARLLFGLARHAGPRAPAIALHVSGQTLRTVRSSSAYQTYWTGVVRAGDTLGKFVFVPLDPPAPAHDPRRGHHHLRDDWTMRQARGRLDFRVDWIRFSDEHRTSTTDLTRAWDESDRVAVARLEFPRTDPASREHALLALLATEVGANPGHWIETTAAAPAALPATRFTAARQLAYARSQAHRHALPHDAWSSFFATGRIDDPLARELIRRHEARRAAGHWTPEVPGLHD